ncbi:MAG TPA: phosphoribosylglycinamide formyltransferase [Rhizobiales bacterium]|nr:phosphoribosylglycinamide formyltransferase [Hyphomicrobiales bacterium]
MSGRKRTAVLISGRGSNMKALIEAAKDKDYPAEIVLVISNRPDAAGLEAARAEGIEAIVIDHTGFDNREAFEAEMQKALVAHGVELVACAGFMRLMTAGFVDKWKGAMINIHPSLLPDYKGLDTHARVLADGAPIHGCSVHFVTADLDSGPVIAQGKVPVLASDTPETLAARVLEQEHLIYPKALAMVARGEVHN